jgi:hypothetical protein
MVELMVLAHYVGLLMLLETLLHACSCIAIPNTNMPVYVNIKLISGATNAGLPAWATVLK